MQVLEKILEEIEEMHYPLEGIGCGLEDIGITDRYEAAEYGWREGIEMASDVIKNYLSGTDNDDWIPVEERLPEHDYETVLCVDAVDYYFVAVYTKEDGFRTEDFGADYENIIAWQPLPDRTSQRKTIRQQNRL